MSPTRLTAASIDRFKPPASGQTEYFDQLLPGFGLRVSYAGSKSFFVMTRVRGAGRLVRVTLGRHPAVSLAEARDLARAAVELAEAGTDPRTVRRATEQVGAADRTTFEYIVGQFLERHAEPHLRASTAGEYRRVLNGKDFERWRGRPLEEIKRKDVREAIEAITRRGVPGAANLAFAYLRKFLAWAAEQEIIEASPAQGLKMPHPLRSRERTLARDEVGRVDRAFASVGGHFGSLGRILLLTGQRRSEVAGMLWSELRDLDGAKPTWSLPGTRTKNGRAHFVPLSRQALVILAAVPRIGDFVFSSTGEAPPSGFSRAKKRVDGRLEEEAAIGGLPPMKPWTLHDLRRTMVTMMNEELGVPPHVVEAVVNHIGPAKQGVAGVYNRALYLDERARALQAWADLVSALRT